MSKPLATRLREAFEAHGALQLPAEHFVIILRSLGATVSAREGKALAKKFRIDPEGHVDVKKFCEWFTGMEQDPRFATPGPTSSASGSLENRDEARHASDADVGAQPSGANFAPMAGGEEAQAAGQDEVHLDDDGARQDPHFATQEAPSFAPGSLENNDEARLATDADVQEAPSLAPGSLENRDEARLATDADVGVEPSNANLAPMSVGEEGHGTGQDEVNVDDDGAVGADGEERGDGDEEPDGHHSVTFSREVTADDNSVWSLGDEDRCTLPSHRRLSEHERLMADFRASLNEVNARLEAAPVAFRGDLRAPMS
eukprot:TRINITY_DN5391_c0_g1_i1.p1 TRINITY_DN5391_c0_g1~~TRINITY_DN5391_c0_g1_i1.p1  ORF type:complete len:315 (-),score=72.83 TRINITY_DN5391_c0_g1_i1:100-1044(-)